MNDEVYVLYTAGGEPVAAAPRPERLSEEMTELPTDVQKTMHIKPVPWLR